MNLFLKEKIVNYCWINFFLRILKYKGFENLDLKSTKGMSIHKKTHKMPQNMSYEQTSIYTEQTFFICPQTTMNTIFIIEKIHSISLKHLFHNS